MSEHQEQRADPEEILCELHIQDGSEKVQPEEVDKNASEGHADKSDGSPQSETPSSPVQQIVNLRDLPKVNCMEKIVLCIDLSKDMEEAKFAFGNGQTFSAVHMVKRTLEILIQTKIAMCNKHQFALVILTDTVVWITDFTSNAKELCDVLKDLNETSVCNSFDLTSLFTTILEKTSVPEVTNPKTDPPPYVIRAIVIYGRSQVQPTIDVDNPAFKKLLACEYFFFDFLYIHPLASHDNHVQAIFDRMCDLDLTNSWYMLEVTYKAAKLHNKVASLLGHPLQRPQQTQAYYKIQS